MNKFMFIKILYSYRKIIMVLTGVCVFLLGLCLYVMFKPYHIKLREMNKSKEIYSIKTHSKGDKDNTIVGAELKKFRSYTQWNSFTKDQITGIIYHDSTGGHLNVQDVSYESRDGVIQYKYVVVGSYPELYGFIHTIARDLPFLEIKDIFFQKSSDNHAVELMGKYTDERNNKK